MDIHYDLVPLVLTFKLAGITTAVLILIGIPLSYWLAFSRFKVKYLIETLVSMPLVLPPTVLGFYFLVAFSPNGFLGQALEKYLGVQVAFSFLGLVIGSVIFSLPFMVNPLKAGFESLPQSLIEASYTLGKSKWQTLTKVILPNVIPAFLAGVGMSFAHTIGEFGVVLMIGGNIPDQTRVASIAIFTEVEALNYQTATFYSLVLVIFSFVVLLVLKSLMRKTVKVF